MQTRFRSNESELQAHSIRYLDLKLKPPIRAYYQNRRKSKFPWTKPWLQQIPKNCFDPDPDFQYTIYSEEALSKICMLNGGIKAFDAYLARRYNQRSYVVVLREINGHTTSMISQAVKGLRQFDYKGVPKKLQKYSLDKALNSLLDAHVELSILTFNEVVVSSGSCENTNKLLTDRFDLSGIQLTESQGIRNQSQGAEGTAVLLALNNVLGDLLGRSRLLPIKEEFLKVRRKMDRIIFREFSNQRKFCPFSHEDQEKFTEEHRKQSKHLIEKYPGDWMDEIFTPVIRDYSVAFISEMEAGHQNIITELLEEHIFAFTDKLPGIKVAKEDVKQAIKNFISNEKQIVMGL